MTKYMTINKHRITIHERTVPIPAANLERLKQAIQEIYPNDSYMVQKNINNAKTAIDYQYYIHLADLFDIDDPKNQNKFHHMVEHLGAGNFQGFWRVNQTCYGVANWDSQSALDQIRIAAKYIYKTMQE